jgi:large subunit ribosomal protein L10e
MARIRKFVAYRTLKRPYTRFSKYKVKNYVRARPVCKVVRFDMGEQRSDYQYLLQLLPTQTVGFQIRDNAIESARQGANRVMEGKLGKLGYFLRTKIYPHHVMRENPLASGAGADRMSTGMAHNYGKPIGIAAQVFPGKSVFEVSVNKENLELAKLALKRASYKIPFHYTIKITDLSKKKKGEQ